ncbi:SprT-like domain-containing protein [Absiella sp. AM27-20]|nr:SprT-like domain-containing protein [Absiella sp. AM27-20]
MKDTDDTKELTKMNEKISNANSASLKTVIEKLESLFSKFNERFYEGELQKPVITVSPDTTKGAYGWCTSWKAWTDSDDSEGYYEINMCAEHLNRKFEEVCSTLLHEMVHLWNLQNEIQDTSRNGSYHNKKFKDVAECHGLIIEKDKKYGWTLTSLNEEAKVFIKSLNADGFAIYRKKLAHIKSTSKQSTRKYVCPSCGCIIRATKEVRVICSDCNVEFEEEL